MKGYFKFFLIGLLITGLCGGLASADAVNPPATVTGLGEDSVGETWINWTWTNPGDLDFSHTIVYIDGTFDQNVSNTTNYLNATGFSASTSHTISTQTVDTFDNINTAWVNDTATTAAAPDIVPPLSITNLNESSTGLDSITWNWNNPSDSDFSHTMVYINGIFKSNVTNPNSDYTATGLSSNTSYEISTHTVDTSENINATWINDTAKTNTPDTIPPASITNLQNISGDHWIRWTWTNPSDSDFSHTMIYINGVFDTNVSSSSSEHNATDLDPNTAYEISTHTVDDNDNINSTWVNSTVTTLPDTTAPGIVTGLTAAGVGTDWIRWTWTNPSDSDFNHTKILINGAFVTNLSKSTVEYNATGLASSTGYTIKVETVDTSDNVNTQDVSNTATTVSKTYSSGNRIWDALANLSTTYTWNANSFSGFYFDLDSGVSSEEMTIKLDSITDRSIGDRDLTYTARSVETPFEYDNWGKYEIVGFMAERYFAGYTSDTNPDVEEVSMMSDGQLSKILIDDDEKESVFSGSSLVLEEGYALNIIEVDLNGDSVFVSLTKDGDELDSGIVSANGNYVYETDLGSSDDVALIIVHFAEIFRGAETNAVFVEGIFQISDEYIEVDNGDTFGKMEVTSVSEDEIKMRNDDSISLSKGKTIDVMGKIKLIVADANELRFAPFVDMSEPGTYELRGTVADNEDGEVIWTPLNFEGFYYDIDEGIETETLKIEAGAISSTDRTIDKNKLVYATNAKEVSFERSEWGKFEVIGFLAEKYFAGYTVNTDISGVDDASPLSDGQLSKVLIDDDEKNSVFSGSSLILEEGYALGIVEVDLNGDRVFVELTKDGNEVDEGIISAGGDYIYETDLGETDDVTLIAVHFEEIFRGTESNAVFVEGIFQISEDYTEIENGDSVGEMEITSIGGSSIEMKNADGSISLDKDDTIDVMTNIQFKVADSNDVRFYPFVEVSTAPLESLDIDMPTTLTEGVEVDIEVTSRGAAVSDARVEVDGTFVGNTDNEGVVEYEPDESGKFTVTAEKENFVSASAEIEVISPLDESRKISLEVSPEEVFEGERITISTVKAVGGDPIDDVEVFYDGKKIGESSGDGTVEFTVTEPGVHKITTSAEGYLEAEFNLNVQELAANFEFSSLVVSPLEVKAGKDATITVSATNTGTASGSYNVDLSINNNVVDSQEITLDIDESTTIEFKHAEEVPGTYLVKVGGQTASYEVVEKTSVVWYILGAGLLAIAGGAIYLFTAGGWTVEMLSAKISELIGSIR